MKKLPAPPVRIASTRCADEFVFGRDREPSSETQVDVKASRLFTSFAVLPLPSAEEERARPSFSSSGRQRSKTSGSPPTRNTSMRAFAPGAPPVSGASSR